MTGDKMKEIRRAIGLTALELGRAIGYQGNDNTIEVTVYRYEAGKREIPPWIARLIWYMDKHGVPESWIE